MMPGVALAHPHLFLLERRPGPWAPGAGQYAPGLYVHGCARVFDDGKPGCAHCCTLVAEFATPRPVGGGAWPVGALVRNTGGTGAAKDGTGAAKDGDGGGGGGGDATKEAASWTSGRVVSHVTANGKVLYYSVQPLGGDGGDGGKRGGRGAVEAWPDQLAPGRGGVALRCFACAGLSYAARTAHARRGGAKWPAFATNHADDGANGAPAPATGVGTHWRFVGLEEAFGADVPRTCWHCGGEARGLQSAEFPLNTSSYD